MTRKEKNAILKEIQELEKEVNVKVLRALGFDVLSNGYIIDQDNMKKVSFKRKYLKYSHTGVVAMHHNDLEFDPVNNIRLMIELFNIFLKKEEEENGLYIEIYYTKQVSDKTLIEAHVPNPMGSTDLIRSESFNLQTLCYIEFIYGIAGILDPVSSQELKRLDELKSYDL